jgi:aminoglycoside phosphotransferase
VVSTPATRLLERPELLDYAGSVLGTVTPEADLSWDYAEAHVLDVADPTGRHWIVKHCYRARVFERETTALRDWAPAVGPGFAPRLVAADAASRTFVMDRLPGRAGAASTSDMHRQAGVLTRRLHDLGPATPIEDFAGDMSEKLDAWLARIPGVVPVADVDWARARMRDLAAMAPTYATVNHGDNQPRNWLLDDAGTVRLIDFGRAGIDAWIRDIERMYFAEWATDPDLEHAFFDGYGRALDDRDRERLRCLGAATSITGRLWAREHHNPDYEARLGKIADMLRAGIR